MAQDSSEEQPDNSTYLTPALTESQRKKLRNADIDTAPGPFLEEKIRSKRVEQLPKRIHNLIEDVILLSEVGFFTEEYDADVWDRVKTDRESWKSWKWKPFLEEILYDRSGRAEEGPLENTHGPRHFGIDLGVMIDRLSGNYLSDDDQLEILLGVIIGLEFGYQQERFTDGQLQTSQIESAVESLNEKARKWAVADSLVSQSQSKLQRNLKLRNELLMEVVEDAGLSSSEALFTHIENEIPLTSLEFYKPEKELEREVELIQQFISDTKNETRVLNVEELLEIVGNSIHQLENKTGNVEGVFNTIYDSETPVSSDDYSKSESGDAMHYAMILAGEKEHSFIWRDYPLVEGSSSNGWETTAIGDVVGAIQTQDQYDTVEVLHRFVFDYSTPVEKQTVEQALDTLRD
jgi:hypothetical protein